MLTVTHRHKEEQHQPAETQIPSFSSATVLLLFLTHQSADAPSLYKRGSFLYIYSAQALNVWPAQYMYHYSLNIISIYTENSPVLSNIIIRSTYISADTSLADGLLSLATVRYRWKFPGLISVRALLNPLALFEISISHGQRWTFLIGCCS